MTWLKIDDQFPENDKVWNLSDQAFRLYVSGSCYAVKKLTDGWVPTSRISALSPQLRKPKETIAELLAARLWHETSKTCSRCLVLREEKRVTDSLPHGGYMIHDFLAYNPPRWKVRADRESKRHAGEVSAQRRAEHTVEQPVGQDVELHDERPVQPVPRTPYPVEVTPFPYGNVRQSARR